MIVSDPDMVGSERVKVLDFGIAKLTESKGQVDTRTGSILGSPGYMSPEQCKNVSGVDERSDIYSLGVILFEMLAGRPPFTAESDAEVMAMHLFGEVPDLQKLAPHIGLELTGFVQRMLRKQPAERPSSTELLSFLNAQSGFPTGASMPHAILKRPSGTALPILSEGETLSRATGQGGSSRQRVARWSIAVSAIVGLLLVVGVVGNSLLSSRRQSVTEPTVHLRILSTPSGAEVIRASDKTKLGQTPYVVDQRVASGSEKLILRHTGYLEHPVTIDRSASYDLALSLTPLPAPPPATAAPPPAAASDKSATRGKPTSSQGKRRKSGKVTNADIDFIK
jgi:serine/threonine protein kinase